MITDSRLERLVELAVSKDDKTPTGNQLVITVSNTLPIVILDDALVTNNKTVETEYISDVDSDSNENYLIDTAYEAETGNERFIYVTRVNSAISNNYARVYYDRKWQDILVLPNMVYINQDHAGNLYSVIASRIGGGQRNKNEVGSDFILNKDAVFALPETKEDINNKHYFLKMHGIATVPSSSFYIHLDADHGVRDKRLVPTGFLSLGSMSDVFVDEEVIPTFTVYQIAADRYVSKYLGNVIPENIYIPLTF